MSGRGVAYHLAVLTYLDPTVISAVPTIFLIPARKAGEGAGTEQSNGNEKVSHCEGP